MIREKQQEALIKVRNFIAGQDLNDPNLTGAVWDIINDSNLQKQINKKNSLNFKENWSGDLIGELQRELVNYQLHQLKRIIEASKNLQTIETWGATSPN